MSESGAPERDELGEVTHQEASSQPRSRKKLMLLAALLFLVGVGVAAAWFFLAAPQSGRVEEEAPPEVFVDVPPIQVVLRGSDGSNRILKLHVMLVPGTLGAEELTARLPMVIDRFQPFLRELRPEDLAGSAATFRVKEELLIRSNQALGSGAVRDVLIQDLMQS